MEIKTIAGRLVRELERKLTAQALNKHFSTNDSIKIYSLHVLHVQCISKGKEHKKYEFGNKVSLMISRIIGVIVGALSFEKNDYGGHMLQPAHEQYKRFYGTEPRRAIADLGYPGVDKIGKTEVKTPMKRADTKYGRDKLRADHRGRSSIETGISHLKNGHRLGRNFYRNIAGDITNVLLASAGCNFKRMMRKWKEMFKYFFIIFLLSLKSVFCTTQILSISKNDFLGITIYVFFFHLPLRPAGTKSTPEGMPSA